MGYTMNANTWPKLFAVGQVKNPEYYTVVFFNGATYRVAPDATLHTPVNEQPRTPNPRKLLFDEVVKSQSNVTTMGTWLNINQVPPLIALHIKKVVEVYEFKKKLRS